MTARCLQWWRWLIILADNCSIDGILAGEDCDGGGGHIMGLYTLDNGDDSSLLSDAASIADHKSIKNYSILYLVLKNGGDWESIDIMEPLEEYWIDF